MTFAIESIPDPVIVKYLTHSSKHTFTWEITITIGTQAYFYTEGDCDHMFLTFGTKGPKITQNNENIKHILLEALHLSEEQFPRLVHLLTYPYITYDEVILI